MKTKFKLLAFGIASSILLGSCGGNSFNEITDASKKAEFVEYMENFNNPLVQGESLTASLNGKISYTLLSIKFNGTFQINNFGTENYNYIFNLDINNDTVYYIELKSNEVIYYANEFMLGGQAIIEQQERKVEALDMSSIHQALLTEKFDLFSLFELNKNNFNLYYRLLDNTNEYLVDINYKKILLNNNIKLNGIEISTLRCGPTIKNDKLTGLIFSSKVNVGITLNIEATLTF